MKETRTPAIADESRRFPRPRVLSNLGAKFLSVSNKSVKHILFHGSDVRVFIVGE